MHIVPCLFPGTIILIAASLLISTAQLRCELETNPVVFDNWTVSCSGNTFNYYHFKNKLINCKWTWDLSKGFLHDFSRCFIIDIPNGFVQFLIGWVREECTSNNNSLNTELSDYNERDSVQQLWLSGRTLDARCFL